MTHEPVPGPHGEVVVYTAPDGSLRVDVRLERDSVWLTQAQMAELFGRKRSVISKRVRNVFREGELEPKAVCAKNAQTAADDKTYEVDAYNLDVVISVGYRVKSGRGTQFRIWATRPRSARTADARLEARSSMFRIDCARTGDGPGRPLNNDSRVEEYG